MVEIKRRVLRLLSTCLIGALLIPGAYTVKAEDQGKADTEIREESKNTQKEDPENPVVMVGKLAEQENAGLDELLQIPYIMEYMFPSFQLLLEKEEIFLDRLEELDKLLITDLLKYRFLYDIEGWKKSTLNGNMKKDMECHAKVWCGWLRFSAKCEKEDSADNEKELLSLIKQWYMENESAEDLYSWESLDDYENFLKDSMKVDPVYWKNQLESCEQDEKEQEKITELIEELKRTYLPEEESGKEGKEEEKEEQLEKKEEVEPGTETTDKDDEKQNQVQEGEIISDSDISKVEPKAEAEEKSENLYHEQRKIIAAIPGYEIGSKKPFQTLRMTREEKKELREKEELMVLEDPEGKLISIMVKWITKEDFLGTDKGEYDFGLQTEENYVWEQPLKSDYENGKIVRRIIITDFENEKKESEKKEKKEEEKQGADKMSFGDKIREFFSPKTISQQTKSAKVSSIGSWDAVNFAEMEEIFQSYSQWYDEINVHIRGNISFREKLNVPAGKKINIISLGPAGSVSLTRAKGFTDSFFYIEPEGQLSVNQNTLGSEAGELIMNGGAGNGYISRGPLLMNDGRCDIFPKTVIMRNKNIDKAFFGGGIFNNGTAILDGVEFSNNVSLHGGAVFNAEEASMTVSNSVLSKNSTYVPSDYVEKDHDVKRLFEHPNGGAVFNLGVLKISASRIQNNTSRTKGGGIVNYQENEGNQGQLEIDGKDGKTIVSGNSSQKEGGGIYNCGKMKISDSTVSNNQAAQEGGGGILTDADNRSEIVRCTIQENAAGGSGGGIFSWIGSKVTVKDCMVKDNKCDGSGGAGILIWENSVTSIQNTKFTGNSTPNLGGAILLYKASLNISDGQYIANHAGQDGGGIYATSDANITVSGGDISGNKAKNYGGGIYAAWSSSLKMTGGEISSNQADYGGGIYYSGAKASVSKGSVRNNIAHIHGGGIFASGTIWTGSAALIEGNKAEQDSGGGIYVSEKTEFTMDGTKINKNTAGKSGGGIHSYKGKIHMKNGNISNNSADTQNGGGIAVNGGSAVFDGTVLNSNKAGKMGGGIADYGQASVAVRSVRLSGNSAIQGKGIYVDAALMMSGLLKIPENNDIYLAADRYVTIDEQITLASGKAAVFTPDRYQAGRKVAEITYGKKLGSMEYTRADKSEKFGLTRNENYILRAADYQEKAASTKENEIVISQKYQITYQKNLEADVSNMPGQEEKYWYENTVLSKKAPTCDTAEFLGWSNKKDSLEAEKKPGELYKDNKNLTLYAVWNTAPVITEGSPLEYWEGEEVTKEMLMRQMEATDKEDGMQGKTVKLRIVKIQYADGRIEDGKKQSGEVKLWEEDMPEEETLDTWHMAMDQADSPVIHTVTYEAADSQGLIAKAEREVKVKYNGFPEIHCADRYFTLEEAQKGTIKEEILLNKALSEGITDVTDDNNDSLDPDHPINSKLMLIGYEEKEFTGFMDSGYVKLSYAAEDSLGKQSVKEFIVYICKDGEEKKDTQAKYVRFINQKNYRQNEGKSPGELSEEEIKNSNLNGGLRLDSYWYQKKDYREVLSSTLGNPKVEQRYLFNNETRKDVKKFVNEKGIGNTKTPNALSEFTSKFLR